MIDGRPDTIHKQSMVTEILYMAGNDFTESTKLLHLIKGIKVSRLRLVWGRGDAFDEGFDSQGEQLGVESSRSQEPNQDPHVWYTGLLECGLEFSLFVDTPDRTTLVGDSLPESRPDRVDGIGETGGKDDQIILSFSSAGKNNLVFGKLFDDTLFDTNVSIDDLFAGSSFEVESTVSCLSKS